MIHHPIVGKFEELSCKGITTPAILEMASFISTPRKELVEATTKEAADKLLHDIPGISNLDSDGFNFYFCI